MPAVEPARKPGMRHWHATQEVSAGGLVVRRGDGAAEAALIGRFDRRGRLRWSLPKGHVEAGETTEQAAVREVAEETGISGRITATLGSVEYSFTTRGRRVHKRVHHFLMEAVAGELSDADVEVAEVAWVPLAELGTRLAYPGERRLASRAVNLLADTA
jgi:8-oxo-dGTP pyrophosphatase MutT (NUDIX family)